MSGAKVRAESRADSRAATLVLVGGSRIADEAVGGSSCRGANVEDATSGRYLPFLGYPQNLDDRFSAGRGRRRI